MEVVTKRRSVVMRAIMNSGNARLIAVGAVLALLVSGGCPNGLSGILVGSSSSTTGNPFATLTEQGLVEANIETQSSEITTGAAAGADADLSFRGHVDSDLCQHRFRSRTEHKLYRLGRAGQCRTEAQRDSLISSGYIEIATRKTIGVAYDLSEGTFVYQGSGGSGLGADFPGPHWCRANPDSEHTDTEPGDARCHAGVLGSANLVHQHGVPVPG
jgi:hypothetical protein